MKANTHELGDYEQRLLQELRAHVEERAERSAAPAPPPLRPHRRRGLALAVVAAAAAVGAIVVSTTGDGASPAYAVERQADGTVEVQIRSLRDADGLERKLRAAGVPAVVEYLPAGKACRVATAGAPGQGGLKTGIRLDADGTATFSVEPGELGSDETLVISTSETDGPDGRTGSAISMAVADGPVGGCEVVDAPAPGAGFSVDGRGVQAGGGGSGPATGVPEAGFSSVAG